MSRIKNILYKDFKNAKRPFIGVYLEIRKKSIKFIHLNFKFDQNWIRNANARRLFMNIRIYIPTYICSGVDGKYLGLIEMSFL